jgi:hypothetical protein
MSDLNDLVTEFKIEFARFAEEQLVIVARAHPWGAIQVVPVREVDQLQDLASLMVQACVKFEVNADSCPRLSAALKSLR